MKLPETGFGGCIKSNEDLEAYLSQIVNGLESPYEYASFEIEAMNALTIGMNCEICDNGVDDDGDGFIDCEDLDCIYEIIPSGIVSSSSTCPNLGGDIPACLGQYEDFFYEEGILGSDAAIEFCNSCRPAVPGDKEGECGTTNCTIVITTGGSTVYTPKTFQWVYHLGFSFVSCDGNETVSSKPGWYLEERYPVLPTISLIVTYLAQAEDTTFPKDEIFECQMSNVYNFLAYVPLSDSWFDKAHNNEFHQQAANYVFSQCLKNSVIGSLDFFDETIWSHYGEYRSVDPRFNNTLQSANGSDQNVYSEVEFWANANFTNELCNGLITGSYIYGTGPELIVFGPGHEISEHVKNHRRFKDAIDLWRNLSIEDRENPFVFDVGWFNGEGFWDPISMKQYMTLVGSFIIYLEPEGTENIYNVTIFNTTTASSGDFFKELWRIFPSEFYRTTSLIRNASIDAPQPYSNVGQKILISNVDISQL